MKPGKMYFPAASMISVPNGGSLDGGLNGLAGVKMLRRINAQCEGRPPVTVRLGVVSTTTVVRF